MDCLSCKYPDTRVVYTRLVDNATTRRRECLRCGARFTTQENLKEPRRAKDEKLKTEFTRDD